MDLAGKIVLVKLVGEQESELIQLDKLDVTGIWFHNASALARLVGDERPALLGEYPTIFVPLAQIEWMMANDKDSQQACSAPQSK
jgi:hypothetical protein